MLLNYHHNYLSLKIITLIIQVFQLIKCLIVSLLFANLTNCHKSGAVSELTHNLVTLMEQYIHVLFYPHDFF